MISKIFKPLAEKAGKQEGQALIVALMFLIALTFLGLGLIMLSSIDIHSARNLRMAEKALTAAEEGTVVAMAFASDPDSQFTQTDQGAHAHLSSVNDNFKSANEQQHFEVDVFMEGNILPPPGWEMAYYADFEVATFKQVLVESRGFVQGRGETFNPANPPHVQQTVELRTRVGSFGE